MDRTAQRAAFNGAIQPFFDAQDASDAAAAKAGQTRSASEAANRAYARAKQTGPASLAESTAATALTLQQQDATDTAAATAAFVKSETLFTTLDAAAGQLLTNPGAVEQV